MAGIHPLAEKFKRREGGTAALASFCFCVIIAVLFFVVTHSPTVLFPGGHLAAATLPNMSQWVSPCRPDNAVCKPVVRIDAGKDYLAYYAMMVDLADEKREKIEVLVLGDSILERSRNHSRFENTPKPPNIWEQESYADDMTTFAIGGETVQNLLWRLVQGSLDGLQPYVVVVLIGANDVYYEHAPADIADAIGAVVSLLRFRFPRATIVLLTVLPRRGFMLQIREVNAIAVKLDKPPLVRVVECWDGLVNAEGNGPNGDTIPDGTHPNQEGHGLMLGCIRAIVEARLQTCRAQPIECRVPAISAGNAALERRKAPWTLQQR